MSRLLGRFVTRARQVIPDKAGFSTKRRAPAPLPTSKATNERNHGNPAVPCQKLGRVKRIPWRFVRVELLSIIVGKSGYRAGNFQKKQLLLRWNTIREFLPFKTQVGTLFRKSPHLWHIKSKMYFFSATTLHIETRYDRLKFRGIVGKQIRVQRP